MSVQHECCCVKALHRTDITGLGIHRVLTLGSKCGSGSHGKGELSVFSIVHKACERPIVPVRIVAPSRVPVKVSQGPIECVIGNLSATLSCQQKKRDHVCAGCIEVSVSVTRQCGPTASPRIIVLRLRGVIDPLLDIGKNLRIACPQITLCQRDAAITDVPRIRVCRSVSCPLAYNRQILSFSRRKQEQHSNAPQALSGFGLRKIIRNLSDNPVALGAIKRPCRTVGTKHRNRHDHGLSFTLDHKFEFSIACFCLCKNFPQLDSRIDILQNLSVNGLNDLALLQTLGGRCR